VAFIETRLNRWGEPTRYVDTRKVANQIVDHWSKTSPDGNATSLIDVIDRTLQQILVGLCDA